MYQTTLGSASYFDRRFLKNLNLLGLLGGRNGVADRLVVFSKSQKPECQSTQARPEKRNREFGDFEWPIAPLSFAMRLWPAMLVPSYTKSWTATRSCSSICSTVSVAIAAIVAALKIRLSQNIIPAVEWYRSCASGRLKEAGKWFRGKNCLAQKLSCQQSEPHATFWWIAVLGSGELQGSRVRQAQGSRPTRQAFSPHSRRSIKGFRDPDITTLGLRRWTVMVVFAANK